jgi:hypothetical protein
VPRRGERVCGQCIESTRGRSTWRAITACPDSAADNNKNIRPSQLQSPFQQRNQLYLLSDKENIEITSHIDFGELEFGQKKNFTVYVRYVNI